MKITELNSTNFEKEVMQAEGTVLIDFWAPWCNPCRMLSPIIDEIAQEAAPGLKVCKVNIDDHPELSEQFGIMNIPTLLVMREGRTVASSAGLQPKEDILKLLERE